MQNYNLYDLFIPISFSSRLSRLCCGLTSRVVEDTSKSQTTGTTTAAQTSVADAAKMINIPTSGQAGSGDAVAASITNSQNQFIPSMPTFC